MNTPGSPSNAGGMSAPGGPPPPSGSPLPPPRRALGGGAGAGVATGLRLLGKQAGEYPAEPSAAILDTFPNRSPGREYLITFECPEFTSLCPVTGQPDYARLRIEYVPDALCIETKSLKFYLASYRNTRAFNEEIVNRILDDLVTACHPRRMIVRGTFSPRGGISVTTQAAWPPELAARFLGGAG